MPKELLRCCHLAICSVVKRFARQMHYPEDCEELCSRVQPAGAGLNLPEEAGGNGCLHLPSNVEGVA